jgi:hypothetical protein
MRASRLFLTSVLFLVIGLVSLWSKWDGSAGISAGDTVSAWGVTFSGSVHGWPAMIGVITLLAAIVVFLWALIRLLMAQTSS